MTSPPQAVRRARSVLLLALLGSCGEPELLPRTQVVAVVYSDSALQTRLTRIEVEVRNEAGDQIASRHDFELGGDGSMLPLSFGIYQQPAGDAWFMLVARGIAGSDETLVEYKVIAQFVRGTTGLLPVVLSSACAGITCEGKLTESCYPDVGHCVPVSRVVPTQLLADGGTAPSSVDAGDLGGALTDGGSGPVDAGSSIAQPVPPSSHGFGSLGGRRGDGKVTVYDDGFEQAERRCTLDGRYCVAGALQP